METPEIPTASSPKHRPSPDPSDLTLASPVSPIKDDSTDEPFAKLWLELNVSTPERSMNNVSSSSASESEASTPGWRNCELKHPLSSSDESSDEGSEDSSQLVKKARKNLSSNF